jgi:hypothetical protein
VGRRLLWLSAVVVTAALGIGWISKNERETPQFAPQPGVQVVRIDPPRPIFRHSVIPGGVRNATELAKRLEADPIAAAHYKDIEPARLKPASLTRDQIAYVSYRRDDRIYWTSKPVRLPEGELVLQGDGETVRARCGNRVSPKPLGPVAKSEPPIEELDIPEFPHTPGRLTLAALSWPGPPATDLSALPLVTSPTVPPAAELPPTYLPVAVGSGPLLGSLPAGGGGAGGAPVGGGSAPVVVGGSGEDPPATSETPPPGAPPGNGSGGNDGQPPPKGAPEGPGGGTDAPPTGPGTSGPITGGNNQPPGSDTPGGGTGGGGSGGNGAPLDPPPLRLPDPSDPPGVDDPSGGPPVALIPPSPPPFPPPVLGPRTDSPIPPAIDPVGAVPEPATFGIAAAALAALVAFRRR